MTWPPTPERFKELMLSGHTQGDIARIYGIPIWRVRQWAEKNDLRLRDITPVGWLAAEEAAAELDVSVNRLRDLAAQGKVPGIKRLSTRLIAPISAWRKAADAWRQRKYRRRTLSGEYMAMMGGSTPEQKARARRRLAELDEWQRARLHKFFAAAADDFDMRRRAKRRARGEAS